MDGEPKNNLKSITLLSGWNSIVFDFLGMACGGIGAFHPNRTVKWVFFFVAVVIFAAMLCIRFGQRSDETIARLIKAIEILMITAMLILIAITFIQLVSSDGTDNESFFDDLFPTQEPIPPVTPTPIPTISNPSGKIAAGDNFSLLLKSDKTVTTYGKVEGIDTSDWENIVQIAAYKDHAVGLCESGRVVVTAANWNEYKVGNWSGIIQVAACDDAVIGVTKYGIVLLEGPCLSNVLECSKWENVDRIIAAAEHVVALTKNGKLLVAANKDFGQTNVTHIQTAIAGAASNRLTFLVLKGGTVKAIGDPFYDEGQVSGWSDIIAVTGGDMFTIGLKSDGTLRSTGDNEHGQRNVGDWTKMIAVCAGKDHTIGLCEDGSVLATGLGTSGQCDIDGESYWAGN